MESSQLARYRGVERGFMAVRDWTPGHSAFELHLLQQQITNLARHPVSTPSPTPKKK